MHEGNREKRSRKCPGRLTGGKSLTESSKIPSKSTCFLWWASAESCDNVKKEARGSPEPDRGAVVSESKGRASGNHGAHSHLLTIAEQEQTLCTRHCSKHLHILAHLISTILKYRFSFYPHHTDEEMKAHICSRGSTNKGQGKYSTQEAWLQNLCSDPLSCTASKWWGGRPGECLCIY